MTGFSINTTEGLTQSFSTIAGDRYQLTYFIGNTTGGGIFGSTSTINVLVNGVQTFSDVNSTPSPTTQNWQQFNHTFVATGA
jgi:archaellum component FlaG (FlaF/FlaG flagellin family)